MAFIWLILAGFVLGMSFNVFALLAFSILAFFACFAAEVHTGLFPAILVAFAVLLDPRSSAMSWACWLSARPAMSMPCAQGFGAASRVDIGIFGACALFLDFSGLIVGADRDKVCVRVVQRSCAGHDIQADPNPIGVEAEAYNHLTRGVRFRRLRLRYLRRAGDGLGANEEGKIVNRSTRRFRS